MNFPHPLHKVERFPNLSPTAGGQDRSIPPRGVFTREFCWMEISDLVLCFPQPWAHTHCNPLSSQGTLWERKNENCKGIRAEFSHFTYGGSCENLLEKKTTNKAISIARLGNNKKRTGCQGKHQHLLTETNTIHCHAVQAGSSAQTSLQGTGDRGRPKLCAALPSQHCDPSTATFLTHPLWYFQP